MYVATVDPMNPRALYLQIADVIEERIKAGTYQSKKPIPSEKQLIQEFGVARGTVRTAVKELVRRDLVVTLPQRGTYVK